MMNLPMVNRAGVPLPRFGYSQLLDPNDPVLAALKQGHHKMQERKASRQEISPKSKWSVLKRVLKHPLTWLSVGGISLIQPVWQAKQHNVAEYQAFLRENEIQQVKYQLGPKVTRLEEQIRKLQAAERKGESIPLEDKQQAEKLYDEVVNAIGEAVYYAAEGAPFKAIGEQIYYSDKYTIEAEKQLPTALLGDYLRSRNHYIGTRDDMEQAVNRLPLDNILGHYRSSNLVDYLMKTAETEPDKLDQNFSSYVTHIKDSKVMKEIEGYIDAKKQSGEPFQFEQFLTHHDVFKELNPSQRERLAHKLYRGVTGNRYDYNYDVSRTIRESIAESMLTVFKKEIAPFLKPKTVEDVIQFMESKEAFATLNVEERKVLAEKVLARGADEHIADLVHPFFIRQATMVGSSELTQMKSRQDLSKLLGESITHSANFQDLSSDQKAQFIQKVSKWMSDLDRPESEKKWHSASEYRLTTENCFALLIILVSITGASGLKVAMDVGMTLSAQQQEKKALRDKDIFKILSGTHPEISRIQAKVTAHCELLAKKRNWLKKSTNPEIKAFFTTIYPMVMSAEELRVVYENQVQDAFIAEGKMSVSQDAFLRRLETLVDESVKRNHMFPEIPFELAGPELQVENGEETFINRLQTDINYTNHVMGQAVLNYMNQLVQLEEAGQNHSKLEADEKDLAQKQAEPSDKPNRELQLKQHELSLSEVRLETLQKTLEQSRNVLRSLEERRFQYQKGLLTVANHDTQSALLNQMRQVTRTQEAIEKSKQQSPVLQELKTRELLQEAKTDMVMGQKK